MAAVKITIPDDLLTRAEDVAPRVGGLREFVTMEDVTRNAVLVASIARGLDLIERQSARVQPTEAALTE
jgi:hypothetical protein